MTFIRRLAIGVSGVVVRFASPGCKEWAEGLAREAEVIEDDWRALWWALGSTRVLLDRREAPIGSLEDVPAMAQKLETSKQGQRGLVWVAGIQGSLCVLKIVEPIRPDERMGAAVALLGWVCLGFYSYINRRKGKLPPAPGSWNFLSKEDVDVWTRFYKAELERRIELSRSFNGWIAFCGLMLVCIGTLAGHRGGVLGSPIFAAFMILLCVMVVPLVFRTRRINQRRLERLNQLLADGR